MPAKAMVDRSATLRQEMPQDADAIEDLLVSAFGERRHLRSVRHLRLSQPEACLCFVQQEQAAIVGSIRYWSVMVAGKRQLLLGPLAVDPAFKGKGYGRALVSHSLAIAATLDFDYVLISGEPDYYPRFGFAPVAKDALLWPGFLEPERFQIKQLRAASVPRQGQRAAILPIL